MTGFKELTLPRQQKNRGSSPSPLVARYRGPSGISNRQAQQAVIIAFGTIRQGMALAGLPVPKAPFVFRDDQVDAYLDGGDGDRRVVVEVVKSVYDGLKSCVALSAGNPMNRLTEMEGRFKAEFEKVGLYGVTVEIVQVEALTPRVEPLSSHDLRGQQFQGKEPGLTPRGGPVRPRPARQFHVVSPG